MKRMDLQEFLAFDKAYMIAPIGISFGMTSRSFDFFLLQVIGEKDAPVRFEGRIIVFDSEDLCRASLERLEVVLPVDVRAQHEYGFICDISNAIKLVTDEEVDRDAVVLNCINTVLDLTTASGFGFPEEYRILLSLADRLTFRAEFGEFKQVRSLVRNALLWCAGVVSMDLRLTTSLQEFETLLPGLSATINR